MTYVVLIVNPIVGKRVILVYINKIGFDVTVIDKTSGAVLMCLGEI